MIRADRARRRAAVGVRGNDFAERPETDVSRPAPTHA